VAIALENLAYEYGDCHQYMRTLWDSRIESTNKDSLHIDYSGRSIYSPFPVEVQCMRFRLMVMMSVRNHVGRIRLDGFQLDGLL